MKNLPNCTDCNIRLTEYRCVRCQSCEMKRRWKEHIVVPNPKGSQHPAWKGGSKIPDCIECGKKTKDPRSKRCMRCNIKRTGIKKETYSKERNPNWRGGITPLNQLIRHSSEMISWRKIIFKRDNYTCQICGRRGGLLEADHVKKFADYPELRFDINNGQTLCKSCHLIKNRIEMITFHQTRSL